MTWRYLQINFIFSFQKIDVILQVVWVPSWKTEQYKTKKNNVRKPCDLSTSGASALHSNNRFSCWIWRKIILNIQKSLQIWSVTYPLFYNLRYAIIHCLIVFRNRAILSSNHIFRWKYNFTSYKNKVVVIFCNVLTLKVFTSQESISWLVLYCSNYLFHSWRSFQWKIAEVHVIYTICNFQSVIFQTPQCIILTKRKSSTWQCNKKWKKALRKHDLLPEMIKKCDTKEGLRKLVPGLWRIVMLKSKKIY